jgi:hypothetical protein
MLRFAASTVAAALVLTAALVTQAADTKDKPAKKKEVDVKRPLGVWTRTDGDRKIVFEIHKTHLLCKLTDGDRSATAYADYGVTRDGVLFGRISKVEKKGGEQGPEPGMLFSFRFSRKGDTLTISDLQVPNDGNARQVIEGDYQGGRRKKGAR